MNTSRHCHDLVIVGAGLLGLTVAKRLVRESEIDFVIIDRLQAVGGVWNANESHSNGSSRVQIIEPLYRPAGRAMADFTPQPELVNELEIMVDEYGLRSKLRLGTLVQRVEKDVGTARACVFCVTEAGNNACYQARRAVLLCTGGLQVPRQVQYKGEELFGGSVFYGLNGAIDRVDMNGKQVTIVGMGAFAIENARTALLAGAAHVTIVARQLNLVLPRLMIFLSAMNNDGLESGRKRISRFRRQPQGQRKRLSLANALKTAANGATVLSNLLLRYVSDEGIAGLSQFIHDTRQVVRDTNIRDPLSLMRKLLAQPYEVADGCDAMPEVLRSEYADRNFIRGFGSRIVNTVPSCSDFFFIALMLKKLTVIQGEVTELSKGRVSVRSTNGDSAQLERHFDADVVIKCLGFEEPDRHLSKVVGVERIHSPCWLSSHVWLMKVEHSPKFDYSHSGELLSFGGSGMLVSSIFAEIVVWYLQHPRRLDELLAQGQLPKPLIAEESYLDMSRGIKTIFDAEPELEAKCQEIIQAVNFQVRGRYSLLEFLQQNKRDWEHHFLQMSGWKKVPARGCSYPFEVVLRLLEANPHLMEASPPHGERHVGSKGARVPATMSRL